MLAFFKVVFYQPLYNGLVFLMDVIPGADAGIAVIVLTILVKLILFPLSKRSIETQFSMRQFQPELDGLKKKYAGDREGFARATMAFYKEKRINPFSSFFLLLIQLPVIISLYYVFFRGGLPEINETLRYAFIPSPEVSMEFLGLIDIAGKSIFLAALAGISQFFQVKLALPPPAPGTRDGSFQGELAHGMHMQMKYVMPIFAAVAAYTISGAVALYWVTSNLFAIGQELVVRRRLLKAQEPQG
ncbi:MAG: preprotein translocase subunit YidC [Parcubacteria group bacterium Gr01-1014_17]|nr:MAG: preprotein translocase subunit YidC [Parcubacteria group bacterium Gr01-1014_17]